MSVQRYSDHAGSVLDPDPEGYWVKFEGRLTPSERRVLLAARHWVAIIGQHRPPPTATVDAVRELVAAVAALTEDER